MFRRREERVIETAEQRFAALQRFAIGPLITSHSIGPKKLIIFYHRLSHRLFSLVMTGTRVIDPKKSRRSSLYLRTPEVTQFKFEEHSSSSYHFLQIPNKE